MNPLLFAKLFGIFKRVWWLVPMAVLAIMLASAKGDARHWHKKADSEHEGRILDQTAYKLAYADAVKRGAERVERYAVATDTISQEERKSYAQRIAAARDAADRLRSARRADQGHTGGASVPGVPASAGGVAGAPEDSQLPPDAALIATEQAIQLDELITWVERVAGVKP